MVYCYNALARGGCQLTINEGVLVDSIKDEKFSFLCTQPHVVNDTAHASDLIAFNREGLSKRGGREEEREEREREGERERGRERERERERDGGRERALSPSYIYTCTSTGFANKVCT